MIRKLRGAARFHAPLSRLAMRRWQRTGGGRSASFCGCSTEWWSAMARATSTSTSEQRARRAEITRRWRARQKAGLHLLRVALRTENLWALADQQSLADEQLADRSAVEAELSRYLAEKLKYRG